MKNEKLNNKLSFSKIEGKMILNFNSYDFWEGLDDILELLRKKYDVIVNEELEGPDVRIFEIHINGTDYSLQYDSYGAFLKSNSLEGEEFLKVIKEELSKDEVKPDSADL